MTRTDVHRPSAIIPADYTFVAVGTVRVTDLGTALIAAEQRAIFHAHKAAHPGAMFSQHEHGGFCHICGSVNLIWDLIYYHANTNTYIRIGSDCADNLEMGYDRFALSMMKKEHKAGELAKAGKQKAQFILTEAGLPEAWAIFTAEDRSSHRREEGIITDIVSKLVKYGSLSDAQVAFLRKLVAAIPQRVERDAQRAAEKAQAPHWTAGRATVEGTVLKAEARDTDWGRVTKTFIKLDDGRTCWGTIPAAGIERNSRVRFAANFTPTDNDPTHAFYNRPTKGEVLDSPANG